MRFRLKLNESILNILMYEAEEINTSASKTVILHKRMKIYFTKEVLTTETSGVCVRW